MKFYSPEEVIIAYNEKKVDLHAVINVRIPHRENGNVTFKMIETTVGRVIFNEVRSMRMSDLSMSC